MDWQFYGFEDADAVAADPEKRQFRAALGRYPTGVTVVTARSPDGAPVGMTVNSFASVSLDPPLVLWSVGDDASCAEVFAKAPRFAVNILAADQEHLARRFALPDSDRFDGVETRAGLADIPLIGGALTVLECRLDAVYPGGDHRILLGRVERFATRAGKPLLFHEGMFDRLT